MNVVKSARNSVPNLDRVGQRHMRKDVHDAVLCQLFEMITSRLALQNQRPVMHLDG